MGHLTPPMSRHDADRLADLGAHRARVPLSEVGTHRRRDATKSQCVRDLGH